MERDAGVVTSLREELRRGRHQCAGEPEAREPARYWSSGGPDPRGVDEQAAAEEAERQAAAAEGRAWLAERVRRGGGVWFPGDP